MKNSDVKIKSGILSLSPVNGILDFNQAKHLLNRCMFGARLPEIEFIQNKTPEEAVDFLLLEPLYGLSDPIGVKESDDEVPVGETWIYTKYNGSYRSERMYSYNNWWLTRLLNQEISLKEKMVLFWHNHFVIEDDVVRNTNYNYLYNKLLFKHAVGNFKILTEEMTINTGMLNYLNGDDNKVGSPNENYARELFELFTIGKGPLIEEGNYTYYTEQDIREAAKVLTGWRTDKNTDTSYFTASRHDESDKIFSDFYKNHTISNQGETEYKLLIQMIFQEKETARHLIRKLYRWFIYYQIDDEIEQSIIEPLATLLMDNNYEIKPVLKELLCSEHFFDLNYCGAMIKNPLEFTIGMLRQLEYPYPNNSDILRQYGFSNVIRSQANNMDMDLGNPPDVAGWPAYYLAPLYNEIWINTATIPNRGNFVKLAIYNGTRPRSDYEKIYFDPFRLAYLVSDPSDINLLIPTLTDLLFPKEATDDQIAELKEILNPGLPDFEWTVEWNKYVNNPNDEEQKNAVGNNLKNMLAKICSMAEYQLI